jgi:hypothetical protein
MAQVQALARPGDRHIHQAAFFLQPVEVAHGVLVREQALLHAGDEHAVELQTLAECTVISCTASCPAWAWLSPASSAACVRKAASGDSVSPVSAVGARASSSTGKRHGIAAKTFLRDEALGRVDQFLQVLDPVGALALGLVVFDQPAVLAAPVR